MKIIEDIIEMQRYVTQLRWEGKIIGFVHTMGALHKGHLSLMEHAKNESDHVVVSIFVNPAQFGPKEDYKEYPRDMEGDTEKIAYVGVDTLFTPSVSAIYPEGYRTYIEVKDLSDVMCGRARPGHLRGVATVVLKLFNIVKPHKAFFGQKDFQQTVIIKKMVEDFNVNMDIVVLPTVRESDGLAMSSRNQYLKNSDRSAATCLYRALKKGRSLFEDGNKDTNKIREIILHTLREEPSAHLEYLAIVQPETLEEEKIAGKGTVIAIAAGIGTTRLIDNIIL